MRTIGILGFVCACGLLFLLKGSTNEEENTQPSPKEYAHLRDLLTHYLKGKREAAWWLEKPPDRDAPEIFRRIREERERFGAVLLRYRDVSSHTREIADTCSELHPSVFVSGASLMYQKEVSDLSTENGIELCFVPRCEARQGHPSSLYYRPSWRALLVFGVQMPAPLFAAAVYRECGHALFHRKNGERHYADPNDNLFIEREILLYTTMIAVLDAASEKRFRRALHEIVKRGEGEFWEALSRLTSTDLEELDASLGGSSLEMPAAAIAFETYLMATGLHAIEIRVPPKKHSENARALYRFVRDAFVSPNPGR